MLLNEVKGEIPSFTKLAITAALDAKIKQVKGKIPSITNLATATALTAVENKIPNVSNLVKKTDYNTNISDIKNKITVHHDHDKYVTTQEFSKLTAQSFTSRLAETSLARKNDIANFIKKTGFDNKFKNFK